MFFGLCEPVCVSLPLHCARKTYGGTVNVPARLSLYKTSSLFTGAMTHGCYSEEALTATQLIRSIWLHMTVPPFISLCLCASTGPSLSLSGVLHLSISCSVAIFSLAFTLLYFHCSLRLTPFLPLCFFLHILFYSCSTHQPLIYLV